MKIPFKSILINSCLFLLGLGLVYLAFKGQNFSEIAQGFKNLKYSYIVYSIVFLAISHFLRCLRWNQLIEPLGFKPSIWDSFQALMIGYLANLALPRFGEITRCGILSRKTGAPVDGLFGTVITERIWDLLTLLFITLLALLFQYNILSAFFFNTILNPLLTKTPPLWIILLGVFSLVFLGFLLRWVWKNGSFRKSAFVSKLVGFWEGILGGIRSFFEMKNKALFMLYTLGIWGGYALSTWILFYAVEATSGLNINASLFILSVGAFGMVAPVQGGIGAYHWMVSHALTVYGISLSSGLVYATVNHSLGVLIIILVGTFSLLIFFLNRPQKSKLES